MRGCDSVMVALKGSGVGTAVGVQVGVGEGRGAGVLVSATVAEGATVGADVASGLEESASAADACDAGTGTWPREQPAMSNAQTASVRATLCVQRGYGITTRHRTAWRRREVSAGIKDQGSSQACGRVQAATEVDYNTPQCKGPAPIDEEPGGKAQQNALSDHGDRPGPAVPTRGQPFRPVVTIPWTKYFWATKNRIKQGSATTILAAISALSLGGSIESRPLVAPCIK